MHKHTRPKGFQVPVCAKAAAVLHTPQRFAGSLIANWLFDLFRELEGASARLASYKVRFIFFGLHFSNRSRFLPLSGY